jgi:hypothetical protein
MYPIVLVLLLGAMLPGTAMLPLVVPIARAQTSQDTATLEQAAEEFQKGDLAGALALTEGVLSHSPNDLNGLYQSALINFHMNNADAARGRLERLVKLSGSYFAALELMVQVTQAQGDLAARDQAIRRLKVAISTAIDPDIRRLSDFIRDRIPIGDKEILVADYFNRGGGDFTRYQFALGDPRWKPGIGLLLRTDSATTENWAETALLPPDKQLFHLDLVDRLPGGEEKVAIYEYYVDQPSYDIVRAKVMQILRGEARPLSGQPGSLQGILKP